MTISLEEELDVTNNRLAELEKNIMIIQDSILTLAEQVKESQRYIIKLAHNQSIVTKRISQWPFIAVPSNEGDEV